MESFSTETLLPGGRERGRARAWSDLYSARLSAIDFIPRNGDFRADLKLGGLGQIGLARLVTGSCTIRRTEEHLSDTTPRLYSFLIQLAGRGRFTQGAHRAVLRGGDFTLCDNAVPHSYFLDDASEMMLIRVPARLLGDYLPYPEQLCGRKLPARAGLTPTAAVMACSLWQRLEQGFTSAHEDSIAHQLLDMIATSYSIVFGPEINGPFNDAALHEATLRFIEDHVRDARLSAALVAQAMGVSHPELLAMFSRRRDNPRSYILRRRLELAARQLRSPRWRGSTVAEIAYGLGFTSLPLFTRAYRRRYGVSPGDYRKAQLN